MRPELTRRRLLAGISAVGVGFGATTVISDTSRGYTHVTYVDRDGSVTADSGGRLRVAWWESYNGELVDTQRADGANATATLDPETAPTYLSEADGPLLRAGNVLPGDRGRLAIGVEADVPDGETLSVWYRARLVSFSEDGLTEPETAAGDTSGNGVELAARTELTVWEDTGAVGGCDGQLTPGTESAVDGGSGSLEDVLAALSDGRQLASCVSDGTTRCLGLTWRLPATGADINVVQSDEVAFTIEFRTAPCDGSEPNPFDGGERNG